MQRRLSRNHNSSPPSPEAYPVPAFTAPQDWNTDPAASLTEAPGNSRRNQPAARGPAVNAEMEGVYIISVAARLLEMHPQTLRKYERLGLIQPVRTVGMLRLYSRDDLRTVMLIRHLMDNLGLNLAGVEFALNLVNNLDVFSRRLSRATGDTDFAARVREEVALLCRSLSLPSPVP
jgi:MerR family transcriptional regulator/heat shock protein HspR